MAEGVEKSKEIIKDIDSGVYDNEIKSELTQTSAEKKKKIDEFFAGIKAKQDAEAKKMEELKAAEEAAKAAAPAAEATAAVAKTEEKVEEKKEKPEAKKK